MQYHHFYRHRLLAEDTFLIWQFNSSTQRHRVKTVDTPYCVTCYCPKNDVIKCSDLNYIADTWALMPVVAHGLVAAAPPDWRRIEIGKYLRVEQLLKVATFAVMVGGAVLLHRAGMNCAPEATTTTTTKPFKERPMSLQELSVASGDATVQEMVPANATVVEVQNESVMTIDILNNNNSFGPATHSLSGLAVDEVDVTCFNTLTIVEDVESEVVASMRNTFSESMYRPKAITISDGVSSGEFSKPLSKQFALHPDRATTFFQRVLVNEPQLPSTTKTMIQELLDVAEQTGAYNVHASKNVISTIEKDIGTFKTFQNYTGSAKPPEGTHGSKGTYDLQYYQAFVSHSDKKIGSIIQTSVDTTFSTEVTEMKRELLQQTTLDTKTIHLTTIQRLTTAYTMPKLKFKAAHAPLIGHSCLLFDILQDSLCTLPETQMCLIVGQNTYLVNGIFDGVLWVYCDRGKLSDAQKLIAKASTPDMVLVPQKRRAYTLWMHVDSKHKDVKAYMEASFDHQMWRVQKDYTRQIVRDSSTIDDDTLFVSPFQFNGLETRQVRDIFLLPPICTLMPFTHYQICTFDNQRRVLSAYTVALDYKSDDAQRGFLCGHDDLEVINETVSSQIKIEQSAPYHTTTLSFFSTFDFRPIRITKITFNRPWVLFPSFYYMTIELATPHGITWSTWSQSKENNYGLSPTFTMEILGAAAEKHLHVRHRSRLQIHQVKNAHTLIFKTPEWGDEEHIHPDVLRSATLGFPLDENMSTYMIHQRQLEQAMQPMLC